MGVRQVFGFIFAEVWFSVKAELQKTEDPFSFEKLYTSIGKGVERGISNAKVKYKELIGKFGEGITAGALSSLTTTLCNIFFTTAKHTVRIIRQTWASMVQATEIILFNPDDLLFGDQALRCYKNFGGRWKRGSWYHSQRTDCQNPSRNDPCCRRDCPDVLRNTCLWYYELYTPLLY